MFGSQYWKCWCNMATIGLCRMEMPKGGMFWRWECEIIMRKVLFSLNRMEEQLSKHFYKRLSKCRFDEQLVTLLTVQNLLSEAQWCSKAPGEGLLEFQVDQDEGKGGKKSAELSGEFIYSYLSSDDIPWGETSLLSSTTKWPQVNATNIKQWDAIK